MPTTRAQLRDRIVKYNDEFAIIKRRIQRAADQELGLPESQRVLNWSAISAITNGMVVNDLIPIERNITTLKRIIKLMERKRIAETELSSLEEENIAEEIQSMRNERTTRAARDMTAYSIHLPPPPTYDEAVGAPGNN